MRTDTKQHALVPPVPPNRYLGQSSQKAERFYSSSREIAPVEGTGNGGGLPPLLALQTIFFLIPKV